MSEIGPFQGDKGSGVAERIPAGARVTPGVALLSATAAGEK